VETDENNVPDPNRTIWVRYRDTGHKIGPEKFDDLSGAQFATGAGMKYVWNADGESLKGQTAYAESWAFADSTDSPDTFGGGFSTASEESFYSPNYGLDKGSALATAENAVASSQRFYDNTFPKG
jgi:hypothetical protein